MEDNSNARTCFRMPAGPSLRFQNNPDGGLLRSRSTSPVAFGYDKKQEGGNAKNNVLFDCWGLFSHGRRCWSTHSGVCYAQLIREVLKIIAIITSTQ